MAQLSRAAGLIAFLVQFGASEQISVWACPICDSGAMGEISQSANERFVMLEAVYPLRNVAQRYCTKMSTDLFGATIIDYRCGRIGTGGRRRRISFEARPEARQFVLGLVRWRSSARQRIGVGYSVVTGSGVLSPS